MLTKPKLGGCIFPDCDFEDNGVDHLRRGANYMLHRGLHSGVDTCEDRYRGESVCYIGTHLNTPSQGSYTELNI